MYLSGSHDRDAVERKGAGEEACQVGRRGRYSLRGDAASGEGDEEALGKRRRTENEILADPLFDPLNPSHKGILI